MKRIISVIILLVFLSISLFEVSASEIDKLDMLSDIKYNGTWLYKLDENTKTAKIYGYNGTDAEIVIPETIDEGYIVNELVIYSPDITDSTELPVSFPVFETANETIESITIPKTIELLSCDFSQDYLFESDDNVDAWIYEKLQNILVKHKDKVIVKGYFYWHLPNLKSFVVDKENLYFSSKDGVLFNKDQSVLINYPKNNLCEKYTIPETVTRIMSEAFEGYKNLNEIVLTKNIKTLDFYCIREGKAESSSRLKPHIVILNNQLDESELKNLYRSRSGDDGWQITVYEDSPAHKYYAKREGLTVLDNPDIEKADKKETTSQKTNSKNKSEASKPYESAPSDTAESIISKPVESVTTETTESEETLTIGATENNTDTTPKAKPEKSNKVWIIIAAAVLLAGGITTYEVLWKKI